MLMCEKSVKITVTISIIFILTSIFVIVNNLFFTKEGMKKYTIEEAKKQNEVITEKINEIPYESVVISYLKESKVTSSIKQNNIQMINDVANNEEKNDTNSDEVHTEPIVEETTVVSEPIKKEIKEEPKREENTKKEQTPVVQTSNNYVEPPKEQNYPPVVGRIEIPKNGVNISIFDNVSLEGMNQGSCLLYSTGELNKYGNSLILGHNYNNFFGRNKDLQIGDKIYVTTLDGVRKEYTVYNKFIETPDVLDFLFNGYNGPEITISTCTDNENLRLVIQAR